MKVIVAILLSLISFFAFSLGIGYIAIKWGVWLAVLASIPALILVAIFTGLVFKIFKDEEQAAPIAGVAIITGIIGAAFFPSFYEAFTFTVDTNGTSLTEYSEDFNKTKPGYINIESLNLCEKPELYTSMRWHLARRGTKMKDSDTRYYGYDGALPLNNQNQSTFAILLFETVAREKYEAPPMPDLQTWQKYCKKEISWVKLISTEKGDTMEFVRKNFASGELVPVYKSSSSPVTAQWGWSIGFVILIILNFIPGLAMIGKKNTRGII